MATSPIHTRICDLVGCEQPIFAFSGSVDVVVAVCRAGGVGFLAGTRMFPEEIGSALRPYETAGGFEAPCELIVAAGTR